MTLQVPDYIRSLVPYLPGKPIEETQREYKIKRVIKLASNENPLGPSPKAVAAMRKCVGQLHRYPDGSGFGLKQALSAHHGVFSQSFILGNGSNEIIDFLIRTFCVPGESIVTHRAAFVAYSLCAQIHGVSTLLAPITDELKCDLGALLELVKKNESAKLVFLANPNNPTGVYHSKTELDEFFQEISLIRGGSVLVVLDDAYGEYVTAEDCPNPQEFLKAYPNLVILRTFSKVYGLAGLRVGYGIGSSEIIGLLEKVRQPFNLNSLALVGATAALADDEFVRESLRVNQVGMRFWDRKLTEMEIPYWRSQGNFILIDAQTGFGFSGMELYQKCLTKGVIFRPVANYGLHGCLRISVGTSSENQRAVQVLESFLKR
jgi:histidinol-phosphate aminotransferase